MNPNVIPVSSLTPQHNLPVLSTLKNEKNSLLLGQERVVDAFTLLTKTPHQHMYLADFAGIDRKAFIDALASQQDNKASQLLIGSNDSNTPRFQWIDEQDLVQDEEKESLVFTHKKQTYAYLSGNIKRTDLVGRFLNTSQHPINADNLDKLQYQAGALAQCHTLFICADSLWKREGLWDLLLNILSSKSYRIHSQLPPVPLNCKIVLVGSSTQYSTCWIEESQFSTHFPLLGEMSYELDLTHHTEEEYGNWLISVAALNQVSLSQSALAPLFLYSARLADHQRRLTLLSSQVGQLLSQARAYSGESDISANDIAYALTRYQLRHNASETLSAQNFDDKFINLPTDGERIGQINGLTVLETVEYCYGEPARITASVHYGDGEVADIERKSELGGNIHAKGMMILSSCLYRIFGKDAPLHLNANIVFEQSYQEIDGDSASLAEYCSLISAITEKPINQSIAATGAIDQFGQVQAIGGVNEKIEGFFNLCERRGLTGNQGVIIPTANTQQLNLSAKLVAAIEAEKFSLFQIEHIDEAVELLMKVNAGVADENNDFPEESLYGLVQGRLANLAGYSDEESTFFEKLLRKLKFSS
ncbi:AAA family ATPase [Shewanella psychropiezotolerans]|uniref:endopeptidase La n=1 Tax=Shewanella psychropiezotolerans TaxID=2593655 RepID=A0ABX5X3Q5_9GAMM|nr:S16 family serine protease [Shewanella psychropiezotolerans]QDO83871.1 AAA family ATPase [Shewanella psychropiezotolerans]